MMPEVLFQLTHRWTQGRFAADALLVASNSDEQARAVYITFAHLYINMIIYSLNLSG
ncbi:hypothetical protein CRENPOLYSF2_1870009 [Crenothrix polyspora]|uniref:Uncharacterized protein n=1 Tax=Crenothrix polyspora TaxID=360316 RepID=A0A1R4H3J2_9GAMM|nr:hypothetical protein CRENPOLYSF2_1870009 [Crenothrix polyspora]